MKKLIVVLLCFSLLLLPSCGEAEDDGRIRVVTTLFPQYDFARQIAGERANIELLLDFGEDAHSFEPSPSDIIKVAKADLFIYTGEEMEIWVSKLLESEDVKAAVDSGTLTVLDMSECVKLIGFGDEHEDEHGHGEYDTHIWTSVDNATRMCKKIMMALSEIDAEGATVYAENLLDYSMKLYTLKHDVGVVASNLTQDTAYFGGSFAFRYLFEEMGISHRSIFEGCSSHAEPSAAEIAAIVSEMKESGAKYVFYDAFSEKKIASSIASESGSEVLHLHAIHNITKAEFDAGETYISLMEKNLDSLEKALMSAERQ